MVDWAAGAVPTVLSSKDAADDLARMMVSHFDALDSRVKPNMIAITSAATSSHIAQPLWLYFDSTTSSILFSRHTPNSARTCLRVPRADAPSPTSAHTSTCTPAPTDTNEPILIVDAASSTKSDPTNATSTSASAPANTRAGAESESGVWRLEIQYRAQT